MASPNRSALLANVFAMPMVLVDVAATLSTARAWEDSRYWRWRRSTECPLCDAGPFGREHPVPLFPPFGQTGRHPRGGCDVRARSPHGVPA
jgi:hypothetical protein